MQKKTHRKRAQSAELRCNSMNPLKKVVPASAKADTTKQKAIADKPYAFLHFNTCKFQIQAQFSPSSVEILPRQVVKII